MFQLFRREVLISFAFLFERLQTFKPETAEVCNTCPLPIVSRVRQTFEANKIERRFCWMKLEWVMWCKILFRWKFASTKQQRAIREKFLFDLFRWFSEPFSSPPHLSCSLSSVNKEIWKRAFGHRIPYQVERIIEQVFFRLMSTQIICQYIFNWAQFSRSSSLVAFGSLQTFY